MARGDAGDTKPLGGWHCVSSVCYPELASEPSFCIYRALSSAEPPSSSPAYLGKAQMCLFWLKWLECPIELCEECGFPLLALWEELGESLVPVSMSLELGVGACDNICTLLGSGTCLNGVGILIISK